MGMRLQGRRLVRRELVLLLVVVLASTAGVQARAVAGHGLDYRDTRSDPDGTTASEGWETIRIDYTTRAVWTGSDGRRWLTLVVAPFDRNVYSQTKFHLDTDGDRIAEFVLTFWSRDLAGEGCWMAELGEGRRIDGRFRRLDHDDYPEWVGPVACKVPLTSVRPTARIGWWAGARVHTTVEERTYDRAPNSGWYA
jgi:hypothetical protein